MDFNSPVRDRDAIKSDGTVVSTSVTGAPSTYGVTLAVATYYFVLGNTDAPVPAQTAILSFHMRWAAAVAATITVEATNFPETVGNVRHGPADVSNYDSTAGNWIQENPSSGDIVSVTGSGNSATADTVTAGGSAAGGCILHLINRGARRYRVKVITTVGGLVRFSVNGKFGS